MKKVIVLIALLIALSFSVYAEVMISEIMYNPDGSDTGREWIEVYNSGSSDVNIQSWKLREENSNHAIASFQGDYIIPSQGFMIIARNGNSFLLDHPGYFGDIVTATFSLSNTGENISILDSSFTDQDDLIYANLSAEGYSIEIIDPALDNSLMANWKSGIYDGDPGNITYLGNNAGNGIPASGESEIPEFGLLGIIFVLAISAMFYRKKNQF
jgi:hypothetical protein